MVSASGGCIETRVEMAFISGNYTNTFSIDLDLIVNQRHCNCVF